MTLFKNFFNHASLAVKYLLLGQLSLYVFVLFCILTKPESLFANAGMSYFGAHMQTIVPFALAILLSSYFTFMAARSLFSIHKNAAYVLGFFVPFMLGVLFTPYTLSPFVYALHDTFASTLFILQFFFALWLLLHVKRDRINLGLVLIQLGGGILAFSSMWNLIPWLLEGQIVFQVGFGSFLIRTIYYLELSLGSTQLTTIDSKQVAV